MPFDIFPPCKLVFTPFRAQKTSCLSLMPTLMWRVNADLLANVCYLQASTLHCQPGALLPLTAKVFPLLSLSYISPSYVSDSPLFLCDNRSLSTTSITASITVKYILPSTFVCNTPLRLCSVSNMFWLNTASHRTNRPSGSQKLTHYCKEAWSVRKIFFPINNDENY